MSATPVFQLLYFSRAVDLVRKDTVEEILTVSRAKNIKAGITGLLLYENHHFMQVLEGSEAVVRSIFETIQKDDRHKDVFTIFERDLEERQFAEWAMAHFEFNESDEDRLLQIFRDFTSSNGDSSEAYPDEEAAAQYVDCFAALLKVR